MNKLKTSAVVVFLLISGCVFSQDQARSDAMYVKAAELRKLSAAVESTVRYKMPSPLLSDEELLALATAHNPILLQSFDGFKVRVDQRDRHAVVLVCSPSGAQALLEDVACTGSLDAHHWKSQTPLPCEFTIPAASVC